jgi:hypothetical protein
MNTNNSKIRLSVALLLLTFIALTAFAATPAEAVRVKKRTAPRVVRDEIGTPWAFSMSLDEMINDDNDSYSGVQFSLTRFYSGSNALRLNLGIADRNPAFDERRVFHADDAIYTFDNYRNFDVTGVTLSVQGMFYSSPRNEPRLFWGLGPRLGVSDVNPDVLITYYDDPFYEGDILDYNDAALVTLGLEGSFGFEWFLGRNLSMMAEYGLAVQNEWYVLDVDYYDRIGRIYTETRTFNDGLHLDASHIKLGMSLYF